MDKLLTDEITNKNIQILKNLNIGSKLFVDPKTLELSIDARNFQGFRRNENRHECLIPILLTLWSKSKENLLESLKKTYPNFHQLEFLEKIIDQLNTTKVDYEENILLTKQIESQNSEIRGLTEKTKNFDKEMTSMLSSHKRILMDKDASIAAQKKIIERLRKVGISAEMDKSFDSHLAFGKYI